ncbi:universal stress protein [Arthrobacter echini]|uniref:Universal stress protein n=1 Tax=Arthrobacter echini TaxID=1529066 RepID=A0A4S5E777_9MICC|nr:universal stress protein [Arthrobacter echini]THJ67465.1 universal stress protein [Arthrobacter echini]
MTHVPASQVRTIVVGVDGSASSVAALQLAASLMPLAGEVIHAVAAWQQPFVLSPYTPMEWNYEEVSQRALDQALTDAFPDGGPAGLESRTVQGAPAPVLIEESKHASMVVVGSRGLGGFAGLLLGSVSSAVAERVSCPVLVSHGAPQIVEGQSVALPSTEASA